MRPADKHIFFLYMYFILLFITKTKITYARKSKFGIISIMYVPVFILFFDATQKKNKVKKLTTIINLISGQGRAKMVIITHYIHMCVTKYNAQN